MKVLRAGSIASVVTLAVSGLVVWTAQAAPNPAGPGDFDGDGHRDLVVNAPGNQWAGGPFGGYAGVFPGTGAGPGRSGASRVEADMTASGDFNGDGFADLATCRYAKPGLVVRFGSKDGLQGSVTAASKDRPCGPVRATDTNLDGYSDLVVATDDLLLVEGSADATTPAGWTQRVLIPGGPGCDPGNDCDGGPDRIEIEIGDVDNDDRPDLAYQWSNAGDYGYADTQLWMGNGDGFTYATKVKTLTGGPLALGDTNGDGFDDLALGLPAAGVRDVQSAGYVRFWTGSANGIDLRRPWRVISQDTPGVPGVIEPEGFGASLAIGDANGDGRAELAIGTPYEAAGPKKGAGSVTVLPGSTSGPNAAASVLLHQDTPGIPGAVETGDHFGEDLAYNIYTDNGHAQLVVGSPYENNGEGLAHVIHGLNKVTATVFTPQAAGIPPDHANFGETIEHSR